jgi:hypothetical protein
MNNIGMLLLAVYLIVVGLKSVLGLTFAYDHMVVGIVAIVTGVLLLLKK